MEQLRVELEEAKKRERDVRAQCKKSVFFMPSNQEIQGVSVMTSEVKAKAMLIANANKEAYSLSATNPFLLQCRYRSICYK